MVKSIIIPKNKIAEINLDLDKALSEELIEIELDEFEFNSLWDSGIFLLINKICNTNIDDFEDEHIYSLTLIKKIYEEIKIKHPNQIKIINAFNYALIYKTSIHFFF